jgi:ribosomal small subunit protein bTHX
MGKGDRRTRRGKIAKGTFGKYRLRKKPTYKASKTEGNATESKGSNE